LQRRVVRALAESVGLRLEFQHVEEILALLATEPATAKANLPDGWTASRESGELRFAPAKRRDPLEDYEYRLPVPGRAEIAELDSRFEAAVVSGEAAEEYNPEHLLDRTSLGSELCVRNWRPGDRFWPAHTKAPKKIKELLQERHLTGAERKLWPIVLRETVKGTEVVWMRGFPVPAQLSAKKDAEAVVIREVALKAET